jgi:PncC family amidohydrolase
MTQSIREERVVPELVRELGEALTAAGRTMAVAESCTGGGLGAAITDRAGSSAYFLGGVIAYDNRLKRDLLDVPDADLNRYGAVSLAVAERMASGCRRRIGTDLALSITGIAGPGGAAPGKPVGLVFIGVATEAGARAEEFHFPGDRAEVRRQAVEAALRLALETARRLDGIGGAR